MNTASFFKASDFLSAFYQKNSLQSPYHYVVLGTGFGNAFEDMATSDFAKSWDFVTEISFKDIPGMHPATVSGHKGILKYFKNKQTQKTLCFQVGRIHGYEGHEPMEVVLPLVGAFLSGTRNFILTNAAGSLNTQFGVGSAMMITDQVNLTGKNPLYGPNWKDLSGNPMGPRFPDMSGTFNLEVTRLVQKELENQGLKVYRGNYLGLMGPTFETPAEVKLFSSWKMDAVGMSTVWESITLKYLMSKDQSTQGSIAGISLLSNMACGLTNDVLDHEALLEESRKAASKIVTAVFHYANKFTS